MSQPATPEQVVQADASGGGCSAVSIAAAERQREAAQGFAAYLRRRDPQEVERDRAFIESSNDIALRGSEW